MPSTKITNYLIVQYGNCRMISDTVSAHGRHKGTVLHTVGNAKYIRDQIDEGVENG